MKKLALTISFGVCFISVFAQYNFKLEITSKTLTGKIYLEIYNNQDHFPLKMDSANLVNGNALIIGTVKQPSNFAAFYTAKKGADFITNFVIDSGLNKITVELPRKDSKLLTIVSNTKGNFISDKMNSILNDAAARYPKPTRVNGYLKIPRDLDEEIEKEQLKALESYPNDYGSLIYLYRLTRMTANPNAAKNNLLTFGKLSDELRNSELGQKLYAEETGLINNKIAASIGNKARIFKVRDIRNVEFTNSDLMGENYLIVFSATWCIPCQEQLPRLKNLYNLYKDKGLKVVYFNNDDDVKRWKEHVLNNKLTWINVSERLKPSMSKIQRSFGVYSIPTCLLINREGIIVYNSDINDTGIDQIESYIKAAVNN